MSTGPYRESRAPVSTPIPETRLTRDHLEQVFAKMAARRVVVVGDAMLDIYLAGDAERISPEAPVPVVTVHTRGDSLRAELAQNRLPDRHIVVAAARPTTSKTRVTARGQQVVRIDEEVEDPIAPRAENQLLGQLDAAMVDADAVLIEDYNKGTLTPAVIERAMTLATKRGIPVVVDPKFKHFFAYRGATLFKPNRRELEQAMGATLDLARHDALPTSLDKLGVDNLLLTLGAEGMVLVTKDRQLTRIPTMAREVFDVSGAGDTVTAWVGTALAAGASVREAAQVANYAAGIEVGKSGVATVSPAEVLAAYDMRYDQLGKLRRGGLL